MPRRRTTRAKPASKVKLPNVEVAAELSERNRQEQLQMYLNDFNAKLKAILKDIDKSKRSTVLRLQRITEAQVSSIPYELRQFTMKEFAAAGGTFEKVLEHGRVQKSDAVASSLQRIEALTCNSLPLITTIQEEHSGDDKMPKPQVLKTAKIKRNVKSRFMKTPAVTPKFNPYVSTTPENIRDEKPGEMLMSMAGTPVRRALRDNMKTLEDNLSNIGLNLTPKTMDRLIETVASSVTAMRK